MRKTDMIKRFVSIIIAAVLCVYAVPAAVLAEPTAAPEHTSAPTAERGTIRGSNADEPSSSKKPADGKGAKATEAPEPTPEATKNPRIGDDGKPVLEERECAVLMNTTNGEVMLEQNADKKVYPASTTKIMTALLTLEAIERGELNLNAEFLIMPEMLEDLPTDGSSMLLKEGEAMSVRYLLEGLLIESGNDAAQALAVIVCGDIPTFVQRMNDKAAELNMNGTHFMNPHGLHDDEHYSTAMDLCVLAAEAMKNKTFREIVAMPQAILPATEKVGTRTFVNTNGLVSTIRYSKYYYPDATGIKTGHTSQAGYCLVSSAQKGLLEVIAVVMNAGSEDDRHYNARNMLSYALDNFKTVRAVSRGDMLSEIKVKFGIGGDHTTLSAENDVLVTVPADAKTEDIIVEPVIDDYIAAPVEQGQAIGSVKVSYQGQTVGTGVLTADTAVKRHPLGFLMRFFSYIWSFAAVKAVVIILGCALLILIVYIILKIRRNIKEAEARRKRSLRRPRRR